MTVAGVASNSADAVRQAQALRPDIILADISLGDESGFDLARRLSRAHRRAQQQNLLVLIVSRLRAIVAGGREEPGCHRRQSLCTSTTITATRCARSSSIP